MRFLRKNAMIISFLYALEAGAQNMHEYSPVEGYLPDSATAIAVAEIILKKFTELIKSKNKDLLLRASVARCGKYRGPPIQRNWEALQA